MRTRAAIIRSSPGKFDVVDIDLEDPRQGELQVKLAPPGCVTLMITCSTRDLLAQHYPMVCGARRRRCRAGGRDGHSRLACR